MTLYSPLHSLVTHGEDRLFFACSIERCLASAEGFSYQITALGIASRPLRSVLIPFSLLPSQKSP